MYTLREVLELHQKWLNDEPEGVKANLRWANLYGADLYGADLSWANLHGANLHGADLRGADLHEANLHGADLSGADLHRADLREVDLSEADLREADLSEADLSWAGLSGANLREADLHGANLSEADLLCQGDMLFIRTMQFDTWQIGYTHDTLQIGCQTHPIEKWQRWGTPAGHKWVDNMDAKALDWAKRNLNLLLQIIKTNPARKNHV